MNRSARSFSNQVIYFSSTRISSVLRRLQEVKLFVIVFFLCVFISFNCGYCFYQFELISMTNVMQFLSKVASYK